MKFWLFVKSLHLYAFLQVSFRGTIGTSFTGDIALDDIWLTPDCCAGKHSVPMDKHDINTLPVLPLIYINNHMEHCLHEVILDCKHLILGCNHFKREDKTSLQPSK